MCLEDVPLAIIIKSAIVDFPSKSIITMFEALLLSKVLTIISFNSENFAINHHKHIKYFLILKMKY